jgi:MYXO-CTERM domain-containing protein
MTRTLIMCAAAFIAGSASADEVPLHTYENSSGGSFPGLDIAVELIDQGSSADLVFHNRSTISAVITDLYIEDTAISAQLGTPTFAGVTGNVSFHLFATPASPAAIGPAFGGAWAGTYFSAGADMPEPNNGIGAGETLTLNVPLGGVAFGDLVSALRDPQQLRIATKVQSLPGGASIWQVTPAPGAAALLGLGGLIATRRRR